MKWTTSLFLTLFFPSLISVKISVKNCHQRLSCSLLVLLRHSLPTVLLSTLAVYYCLLPSTETHLNDIKHDKMCSFPSSNSSLSSSNYPTRERRRSRSSLGCKVKSRRETVSSSSFSFVATLGETLRRLKIALFFSSSSWWRSYSLISCYS